MMDNQPLEFLVPEHLLHTKNQTVGLPEEPKLLFHIGTPYLTTWGTHQENYILQQVYTVSGATMVMLSIKANTYTKMKIKCAKSFNAFQYTIQGFSFARLNGYGCVPLFEKTYTLQYIPEGIHEVLFVPEEYHFFYIVPGQILEALATPQSDISELLKLITDRAPCGKLGKRHATSKKTMNAIERILNLSERTAHYQLILTGELFNLLTMYQEQQAQNYVHVQPENNNAIINAFMANNIHFSVGDLIKNLKEHMFIETRTLRNIWIKCLNNRTGVSPRKSLKNIRLEKGLYHLTVENLTVTETSRILNFQDVSAFSKQFRAHFKMPPNQAQLLFLQ